MNLDQQLPIGIKSSGRSGQVTAYGVCLLPSTYGMVLGFTQSINKRVSLKSVGSIVIDRGSLLPFNPTYGLSNINTPQLPQ